MDDSTHGTLVSQSVEVGQTQQLEASSSTLVESDDQKNVCHDRMGYPCSYFSWKSCICPLTVL